MQCVRNCPFILNIISLSHDLHNCMFLFTFHHVTKFDSKLNQHCYLMYQVLYIVQFIYCESSFNLNCYFESYKVFNSNSYYKSKYSLLHYLSKSYCGRKGFLSLSCFNIMPMIFVKFETVLTIHIWVSFNTLFLSLK